MLGLGMMVAGVPLGLELSASARRDERQRSLGTVGMVFSYIAALLVIGLVVRGWLPF